MHRRKGRTHYAERQHSLVHHNAIGHQQLLKGERPLVGHLLEEVSHLEYTPCGRQAHLAIPELGGGWGHFPRGKRQVLEGRNETFTR